MEYGPECIEGFGGVYTKVRQDEKYIASGKNDNQIVKRLGKNKEVSGYSFLNENRKTIGPGSTERLDEFARQTTAGLDTIADRPTHRPCWHLTL